MILNMTAIEGTNGKWRMAFDMQRSRFSKEPTHWLVMTDGKSEYRSLLNAEALGDEETCETELRRATDELMSQAGLSIE